MRYIVRVIPILLSFTLGLYLLLVACGTDDEDNTIGDPILIPGKSDSSVDARADYECNIILRGTRPDFSFADDGTPECGRFGCKIQVLLDVKDELIESGGVPKIAFSYLGDWFGVVAEDNSSFRSIPSPPEGYLRFQGSVEYDEKVNLIPYLEIQQRGITILFFDHNVNEGIFDNYSAESSNGWMVQDDQRWSDLWGTCND